MFVEFKRSTSVRVLVDMDAVDLVEESRDGKAVLRFADDYVTLAESFDDVKRKIQKMEGQ